MNEFLRLALKGGEELLGKRTFTTMGIRFPAEPYPGQQHTRYEFKLYDGSAGVGLTLLDLYAVKKDPRYAKLCDEISHGLIQSTPEYGELSSGLFSGFSGVALFHLARARVLQKGEALDRAIEIGIRLSKSKYVDTDILGGAAGSGLLQIALYYATRDPVFLNGARSAATFLEDTAIISEDQASWFGKDPKQPLTGLDKDSLELATQIHSGLAHGVAGICLFLAELAAITNDASIVNLCEKGFRWLDAQAIRFRNKLVWFRNDSIRVIQDHWCHGSAGIAHAYLAWFRLNRDQRVLNSAVACAEATWEAAQGNSEEPLYHCHGISGAIDLFLELDNHRAGKIWRKRALALANRFKKNAKLKNPNVAEAFGGKGPGLALGTAGIVRQLLRLSGYPIFSILTPSHDQITLKPESIKRQKLRKKTIQSDGAEKLPIQDLVPHTSIRFANANHFVVIGRAKEEHAKKILQCITESTAGDAYFRSLSQITRACDRLRSKYSRFVCPEAIHPGIVGGLLREIAAMTLCKEAQPAVVKHAASTMTKNSIAALDLMFERLHSDIRGSLAGEIGGKLKHLQVHASDPHRGGQRVVQFQFEDGPVFLYKARPMAIDAELVGSSNEDNPATLAQLCREWLQVSIPGGFLPTHRIIPVSHWYGYAEIIQTKTDVLPYPDELIPQKKAKQVRPPEIPQLQPGDEHRYWYSTGLVAGHAFTLGIQDLHAENVICGTSRSTPKTSMHTVDLELAFGNVIDLEDTHLIDGPRWRGEQKRHTHSAFDFFTDFWCGLYAEDWVTEITSNGPVPVSRPYLASRWIFPHMIRNSDGSLGYENYVCHLLRGFADQWSMLQKRSVEVSNHLRTRLQNVPMRVVLNPSRSYAGELIRRKIHSPIIGIAMNPALPFARPLFSAEVKQLNDFDIPYFFRYLNGESKSTIFWVDSNRNLLSKAKDVPVIQQESPFWDVVQRQADPNRLARAVVDIAWAIAPDGPFDFYEPALDVRVMRKPEDTQMLIVLLLGANRDQRLTCRVAPEGTINWWLE